MDTLHKGDDDDDDNNMYMKTTECEGVDRFRLAKDGDPAVGST